MEVLDERLVYLLRVVIPSSELLKKPEQESVNDDISDLLDLSLEEPAENNMTQEDATTIEEEPLVNEEEILPQGEMFAIDVDDLDSTSTPFFNTIDTQSDDIDVTVQDDVTDIQSYNSDVSVQNDDNNQPQVDIINKEQSDIELAETETIEEGKQIISDQEELINSKEEAFNINNEDLVINNDEFNNLVEESILEQDTLNLTPAQESIFNDDVNTIYEDVAKDDSELIGTIIGNALDDIEAMVGKNNEEPEQESEELLINRKYLESEMLKEEIQIGSVKVAKKTMFDFTYDTNSEINIEVDNDWFEDDEEEEPVQQIQTNKKKKFNLFGKRKD